MFLEPGLRDRGLDQESHIIWSPVRNFDGTAEMLDEADLPFEGDAPPCNTAGTG
jgi:hypothetical protein